MERASPRPVGMERRGFGTRGAAKHCSICRGHRAQVATIVQAQHRTSLASLWDEPVYLSRPVALSVCRPVSLRIAFSPDDNASRPQAGMEAQDMGRLIRQATSTFLPASSSLPDYVYSVRVQPRWRRLATGHRDSVARCGMRLRVLSLKNRCALLPVTQATVEARVQSGWQAPCHGKLGRTAKLWTSNQCRMRPFRSFRSAVGVDSARMEPSSRPPARMHGAPLSSECGRLLSLARTV